MKYVRQKNKQKPVTIFKINPYSPSKIFTVSANNDAHLEISIASQEFTTFANSMRF